LRADIDELHRAACNDGRDTYIDPVSGYQVLTSKALLKQGACCGNSCRHCPYGHINVGDPRLIKQSITEPILMNWSGKEPKIDVLFWSGGKDSFLALDHLLRENKRVVLLTSFGALTNRVSIQNIHIKNIAKQADFLKLPLCLVPLFPNTDYKNSIQVALDLISNQTGARIDRLVFGDLHLQSIRQWRVDVWPQHVIYTPLFEAPYEKLLSNLWGLQKSMDLEITLSTKLELVKETLDIGTIYNQELVQKLIENKLDAMLENGEAHTLVFPRNWKIYQEETT
jgi:ATP-binding cassette subfamily B (MDR/TAP) protein 1